MNQFVVFLLSVIAGPCFRCLAVGCLLVIAPADWSCAQTGTAPRDNRFSQPTDEPPFSIQQAEFGAGFPERPLHFDPQVQPVEARTPAVAVDPHTDWQSSDQNSGQALTDDLDEPSPDDLLQSVASMWGNVKQSAQQQWAQGGWSEKLNSIFGGADVGRMLGSLALVLGGYFTLVWIVRMVSPSGGRQVPREVLEVLGTVPLEPRKNLQIIRLGSKLLLLINGPEGTHPIGEINDPAEVEYLASLCPGRQRVKRDRLESLREAAATLAQLRQQRNHTRATIQQAAAPTQSNAAVSNAGTASHLAAILQSLNGPSSGNAATFEA